LPINDAGADAGSVQGSIDENGVLTLEAPQGSVFDVVFFASYGLPDNYQVTDCHATDSQSILESLAIGNSSVSISASNDIFGDPCGGIQKWLQVTLHYSPVTPEPLSICPPTNLTIVDTATSLILNWSAPSCGNTQPERYAISFSGGGGGWGIATGNGGDVESLKTTMTVSYVFLNSIRPAGTQWTFSIRSDNDTLQMYSSNSNQVAITIGSAPEEPNPSPSPTPSPDLISPSPSPAAQELPPTPQPSPVVSPSSEPSPSPSVPAPSPTSESISATTPSPEPVVTPTPQPQPTPQPEQSTPEPIPSPSIPPAVEPTPIAIPDPPPAIEPEPIPSPDVEPTPDEIPIPAPEPEPLPSEPEQPPAPEPEPEPQPEPVEPPDVAPEPEPEPAEPPPPIEEPSPEPPSESPAELLDDILADGDVSADEVESIVDALQADGKFTEAEKEIVAEALIAQFDGAPVSAAAIAEAGIDYEDLPPETPVETRLSESGEPIVITAEVADALELVENPAELVGAIFTDPAKALMAIGNIGADMSDTERQESQTVVVASVIVGAIASLSTRRIK
jgi:hypothetical protein